MVRARSESAVAGPGRPVFSESTVAVAAVPYTSQRKRHIILHTRTQKSVDNRVSLCLHCDAGHLLGVLLVDG
jgi:hypothetical protein